MSEAAPITLDEMIACAEREVRMRKRVYPRWVEHGRMTPQAANRETRTMEAILAELEKLKQGERLL